ncbi:MAG TPA: hypothetical protein VI277_01385 [Candidatus Limnocylindria bacterium]
MSKPLLIVLALVLTGCVPTASPSVGGGGVLEITVVAGPVCPVESEEPDPACAPRPVADARVFVQPGDGRDILVAEGATDHAGIVRFELPPGDYIVSGGEVDGLFGLPEATAVTVTGTAPATVTLGYDTGIR